jgi:hypothetical protein
MSTSMITANVFRADAFSGLTITDQVNRIPFLPTFLGDLGIFDDEEPIMTTDVQVDREDGILTLIPTSPRGAPGKQRPPEKRQARYFAVPRLFQETTIYASSLQNVRSERDGMQLMDLQEMVAKRLTGPTGILNNIAYTYEYHRLGAIQGLLLDVDGRSIINNWFAEFGIPVPVEIGFDLGNVANRAAGYVRAQCNQIHRLMARAGKGAFIEGITEVHALCGDAFYDAFVNHPDVIQTYINWAAAEEVRTGKAFTSFYFGGIFWHNYRGSDDNLTLAIPTDKVKFFPRRAPGVFKLFLAPGEGFESVNTRGKKIYVYRNIDPSEEQAWVKYDVKSYPLHICTRPEMLLTGRMEP